jgi:hypothetical protein
MYNNKKGFFLSLFCVLTNTIVGVCFNSSESIDFLLGSFFGSFLTYYYIVVLLSLFGTLFIVIINKEKMDNIFGKILGVTSFGLFVITLLGIFFN